VLNQSETATSREVLIMWAISTSCGGLIVSALLCAGWVAADPGGSGVLGAPTAADGGQSDAPVSAATGAADSRLREGELLENQLGTFDVTGERVHFTVAGRPRVLPVLENLALERVARMLEQQVDSSWLVTGTVTEYRGRNYLLLERAVVRAADQDAAGPVAALPRS
jgi:hypothetical protein